MKIKSISKTNIKFEDIYIFEGKKYLHDFKDRYDYIFWRKNLLLRGYSFNNILETDDFIYNILEKKFKN